MDRRRYVPSPEGLEGRALMSLFGTTTATSLVSQTDTIPETSQEKALRVHRLPYYLEQFEPGRVLPKDTISELQNDLMSIAAKLHPPTKHSLNEYNHMLRDIVPHASLHQSDARQLNRAFGSVLSEPGATPQQVTNLQNDLVALAKVDANSKQSAFLATNDYSTILQTVLGVGRPIEVPIVPTLALKDQAPIAGLTNVTGNHQPTVVGTYVSVDTTMLLIDATTGKVLGTGVTSSVIGERGQYSVQVAAPLPDGRHFFYLRAYDTAGNISPHSLKFGILIVTGPLERMKEIKEGLIPPQGPLGLSK